jgi:hypothetical protein
MSENPDKIIIKLECDGCHQKFWSYLNKLPIPVPYDCITKYMILHHIPGTFLNLIEYTNVYMDWLTSSNPTMVSAKDFKVRDNS